MVSSRTCLASSTNGAGTSTSLGPADRKSGASKPAARWISDGMPASFSTPSISSATDSSGAAATFTHLSSMHVSYPRLLTQAPRNSVPGSNGLQYSDSDARREPWILSIFYLQIERKKRADERTRTADLLITR